MNFNSSVTFISSEDDKFLKRLERSVSIEYVGTNEASTTVLTPTSEKDVAKMRFGLRIIRHWCKWHVVVDDSVTNCVNSKCKYMWILLAGAFLGCESTTRTLFSRWVRAQLELFTKGWSDNYEQHPASNNVIRRCSIVLQILFLRFKKTRAIEELVVDFVREIFHVNKPLHDSGDGQFPRLVALIHCLALQQNVWFEIDSDENSDENSTSSVAQKTTVAKKLKAQLQ